MGGGGGRWGGGWVKVHTLAYRHRRGKKGTLVHSLQASEEKDVRTS